MLVLARKTSEKIVITTSNNEVIELTILSVDQRKVKLGIKADPETRIFREELIEEESTTPAMA